MEESLTRGERVEVRRRFDAGWATGFEVVDLTDDGYRVRRTSDGEELPVAIPVVDVRAERRPSFR